MQMALVFFVVALCLLDPIAEGTQTKVIDDVTTIYKLDGENGEISDVENIEIHVRTNALGLPPKTEFGFLEPANKIDDLLCFQPFSWEEKKCNWISEGFTWEDSADVYGTDNYFEDRISKFKTEMKVQLCKDSREDLVIEGCCNRYYRSQRPDQRRSCNIYIKSSNSSQMFYRLESSSNCKTGYNSAQVNVYTCTPNLYKPTNLKAADCLSKTSFNLQYLEYPMTLFTNDNRLQVSNPYNNYIGDMLYLNSTWKSIETDHDPDISPAKVFIFKVLRSQRVNYTLTSPRVVVPNGDLCLQVVFHTDDTQLRAQLSVSVVDAFQRQETLEKFNLGFWYEPGWNFWRIEKSLPEYLQKVPVSIVLTTLTPAKIDIQRIASCKNEDNEEVSLMTVKMLNEKLNKDYLKREDAKPYFVSYMPKKLETNDTNVLGETCLNGGVLTDAGCACPAGFTGPSCSQACGPNRYGQDCEGQCSMYDTECKGLLLCTPGAGCHCAPGYHGSSCMYDCDYNEYPNNGYGADCSESCGHCYGYFCDKYTGHCLRCISGYYPPMCKEKLVHFKSAPLVSSPQYGILKITINLSSENLKGLGNPLFYQVQYKTVQDAWNVYITQYVPKDEETVEMVMGDLEDATKYEIRVVLLADDYNSYQADDLPSVHVHTKCEIPDSYDYAINVTSNITGAHKYTLITWSYLLEDHWCPVEFYEFWWKEGWQWKNVTVGTNSYTFNHVLPDKEIVFKVRAKVIGGYAPYSETETVFGLYNYQGSQGVEDLKAVSVQRISAEVSWRPPSHLSYAGIHYQISYQCLMQPSCSTPCAGSSGTLSTTKTSVTLGPLLPAAQYMVSVAPDSGRKSVLYLRTLETAPEEIPQTSQKRVIRTNASATVFWEPVEVCTGFLNSYHYQLSLAADDGNSSIESGQTRNTSATFNKLVASTDYVVRVSVMSTGGWDPSKHLTIHLSTAATVPEPVRNLTVYKRGRNMVGLRWAEPRVLYGALESFTVAHSLGGEEKSVTVPPTPCVPWPHLYCHTVSGLKPARYYNFFVNARNKEIHEDGAGAFILAPTRENTPGAPNNLTVVNVTSTSLGLQWEHPSLANGVLRSFLVSVEETEQHNQDQCCQIYPIIEVAVSEEQRYYQLEVSGLHPASMYTVSVSGKTVGFGPSQTVNAATRPPHTTFNPPDVGLDIIEGWKWLPQTRLPDVNNSQVYSSLVKSRILLVLRNESALDSGIEDPRLYSLLQADISSPFYLAAEYGEGDGVALGTGEEGDCQWGHFSNPSLMDEETHQLAAVLISEYNKVLNIDTVLSTIF